MRISDWSSDVCSSDLAAKAADAAAAGEHAADPAEQAAIAAGRPSRGIATEEAAQHISQASLSIEAAQSIWSRRVFKACPGGRRHAASRSEEHTSELQSLMRRSYAVFCLKNKKKIKHPLDNQH